MAGKGPALVGRHLSFRYAGATADALSDVSVVLTPGRRIAVIGANGSGKTTLLLLLKGLLEPSEGEVLIDGRAPTDVSLPSNLVAPGQSTRAVQAGQSVPVHLAVGYVFQNPDSQIVATRVDEDVAFGPENLGLEGEELVTRVYQALAAVGLSALADREPHTLSGGEKQRLAIAGALALRPRYLLLDEATSMLDPGGRAQVRAVVSSLRAAGELGILEVTHDLEEALDADEVMLLHEGRVVKAGSPRSVMGNARALLRAGLAPLPATRLAEAMRAKGLPVRSDALTAEEVLAGL